MYICASATFKMLNRDVDNKKLNWNALLKRTKAFGLNSNNKYYVISLVNIVNKVPICSWICLSHLKHENANVFDWITKLRLELSIS